MEYGCIGRVLKHSFSKDIHAMIADYDYQLTELEPEMLDAFMRECDFSAINVTIPYKEAVIPYLSEIDEGAKLIGAVNTIVNRGGKLYGYNTDFFGMSNLFSHLGVDIKERKVLILGTGGTSKTAYAVAKHHGAKEIIRASRDGKESAVLYTDVYKYHTDAEIIINTTPVGMYPNSYSSPINLTSFKKLICVVDAVYNPSRTELILDAHERGIVAEGGLYMLVAQAVRASEIFLGTTYDSRLIEGIYNGMLRQKENIVLIGMPASGKSTVGALLADILKRELIDTDEEIIKKIGMDIPTFFAKFGEAKFRNIESEVIKDISKRVGVIISTGGGAILRGENVRALKQNGTLYFIDRPLSALIPTSDRPLSSTKEAIEQRYNERYDKYCKTADVRIDADCDAISAANKIQAHFNNNTTR